MLSDMFGRFLFKALIKFCLGELKRKIDFFLSLTQIINFYTWAKSAFGLILKKLKILPTLVN